MGSRLLLPTNLLCGYFDCTTFGQLSISPKRICTIFEIEYYLEDAGNTYSDGVAYPIRRNWMRLCVPGEERYSELPFKTKYVKFAVEGRLAEILRQAPSYFRVYRSHEALSLLDDIISLSTANQSGDNLLLYAKLLEYVSLILEESERSQTVDSYQNKIAIRAQNFIKEHYGEPIRLSDIAKEINLSPNYFHTMFTEACGTTPRAYLEEYRISVAKKLLLTTRLSLSEIAEHCGFKTQQYLASVFKSHVGISPAEFRSRHQNAYLSE